MHDRHPAERSCHFRETPGIRTDPARGLQVLRNRIRLLCLVLPVLQALQCGAAGVTVIKRHPSTWAHEVGKFVASVSVLALIFAICTLLVVLPLHAASAALRMVAKVRPLSTRPRCLTQRPVMSWRLCLRVFTPVRSAECHVGGLF